jgi:hypothetical protein
MNTLRIEILNPKAKKLIKDLEDLKLISIQKKSKNDFLNILQRIRKKAKSTPALSEITTEVEAVRSDNVNYF